MRNTYLINVTIHVLAAMFWLGGMLFLGVVGAPLLRKVEPPSLRQQLFNEIGLRFRTTGWIAISALVVTGLFNLWFRGWLHWESVFGSAAFWSTAVGRALAVKLAAVSSMVIIAAVHDFALGPAASNAEPGSDASVVFRRRAAWLARINAIIGIILLIAAVRLARA